MLESLKQWDRDIFIFLNGLGIERFDSFWIFVTQISNWTPLFIFFIVIILYHYPKKRGLVVIFFLLLTFVITFVLTLLVKDYVGRLRPNNVEALSELIRILQTPSNFSFFSGHASSSFAITTFMVLIIRKFTIWIYLAFLWPLLFVLSRIFVGVHYPSDILVGALVGTLIAVLCYNICLKVLERRFPLKNT